MPIDRARAARALEEFLVALGRDPASDPDLSGTGDRVTALFADELCAGYAQDPHKILADNLLPTGDGGAPVVVLSDLPVATTCPHHLLPSFGTADVAFAPDARLVGVGAVGAVVNAYARRLTLQETLSEHVAEALSRALAPRWVACRITLTHGCMVFRGDRALGAKVSTFSFRGDETLRAEASATLAGRR